VVKVAKRRIENKGSAVVCAFVAPLLVGCLSRQLEGPRRVWSESVVLSREAGPRLERDCDSQLAKLSTEEAENRRELCRPIVGELVQLKAQQKALREAIDGASSGLDLDTVEALAKACEEAIADFRAAYESYPLKWSDEQ
jgi:hypothetical protein